MAVFLEAAAALREKLGTILVQLPPNFKKDDAILEDFLSRYVAGVKLAFEFRHDSWLTESTYTLLAKYGAAWAIVEAEEREAMRQLTAPFIYMRLRKGDYTESELNRWADWIMQQDRDIYCYLKHDERAPVLALQLMQAARLDRGISTS